MQMILKPDHEIPGDYVQRRIDESVLPINESQRAAVRGLRCAVEKIQGPPGTGKSTTIQHILEARIPRGQRVLITGSRNVAVESLALKLKGLESWPMCVFGAQDRVGEVARRHMVDVQAGHHFEPDRARRVGETALKCANELGDALESKELACKGY